MRVTQIQVRRGTSHGMLPILFSTISIWIKLTVEIRETRDETRKAVRGRHWLHWLPRSYTKTNLSIWELTLARNYCF